MICFCLTFFSFCVLAGSVFFVFSNGFPLFYVHVQWFSTICLACPLFFLPFPCFVSCFLHFLHFSHWFSCFSLLFPWFSCMFLIFSMFFPWCYCMFLVFVIGFPACSSHLLCFAIGFPAFSPCFCFPLPLVFFVYFPNSFVVFHWFPSLSHQSFFICISCSCCSLLLLFFLFLLFLLLLPMLLLT